MTTNTKTNGAITVEVPRPDGSSSLFVGREVRRTSTRITLVDCAWIAETGRRHLFMAGTPDSGLDAEPYPGEVELPLAGSWIAQWPGRLPLTPS